MDFLLERLPPVSLEEMREFGWSEEGRSPNMLPGGIHGDPLRVQRKPTPNSTDGIRGQKAMLTGLHIWEVRWPRGQRGTYSAIGVGTSTAELQADGYCPLLGQDENSFGWDIVSRKCRHDGQEWDYPKGAKARRVAAKTLPDRLFAILDCQKGTLAFATQTDHLGIAFRNLDGLELFPMVATVFGHAQISIHYLGCCTENSGAVYLTPPPLADICRRTIHDQLALKLRRGKVLRRLGLPPFIVAFMLS